MFKAAWTVTTLSVAGAALASPLPLARGDYVIAGQSCREAPFAAMMRFDGRGFSGPHASQCTSVVLSRAGKAYRVRTTCNALGDGTRTRPSAILERYTVISSTRFVSGSGAGALTYRLCHAG